jgi:phage terminase large subunit-like protein/nitrogen regulatory protein PII-like uncharacterized protein
MENNPNRQPNSDLPEVPPPGFARYRVVRDTRVSKIYLPGDIAELDPIFAAPHVESGAIIPCPEEGSPDDIPTAVKKYKVVRMLIVPMGLLRDGTIVDIEPRFVKTHVRDGSMNYLCGEVESPPLPPPPPPRDDAEHESDPIFDAPTAEEAEAQKPIPEDIIQKVATNPKMLFAVTKCSFQWFFCVFFWKEYVTKGLAPFHFKFFNIAQDKSIKRASVVAFRMAGKSAILNTAYAVWAIMGIHQKRNVIVVSKTKDMAQKHLKNIRMIIEDNAFLRKVFGPFGEGTEEWRNSLLEIPKYHAQIAAMSLEEGKRGGRFGAIRPDLMIIDDIEDTNSIATQESRDKIWNWLVGEIMALGDEATKIVFLGNIVHEDAVLMRIEKSIQEGRMKGVSYRIPIMKYGPKDEFFSSWPSRFPTREALEEFKSGIPDEITWQREYMLRIVPPDGQIIKPEDIHYSDEEPETDHHYANISHGVDLAISKKQTADYTAIVSGNQIYGSSDYHGSRLYIQPNPINRRMDFEETIKQILVLADGTHHSGTFFVENVSFQQYAIEVLGRKGVNVIGMRPGGDKQARLMVAAKFIKDGSVLFPRTGCEHLLRQLFNLGTEKHDDLVDALVYLILGTLAKGSDLHKIIWLDLN